jgi:hypothetical protein
MHHSTKELLGEKREDILKWISTMPYMAHHRDVYDRVLPDSGKWLFEREEFAQWSSVTTSSLLWLRGDGM